MPCLVRGLHEPLCLRMQQCSIQFEYWVSDHPVLHAAARVPAAALKDCVKSAALVATSVHGVRISGQPLCWLCLVERSASNSAWQPCDPLPACAIFDISQALCAELSKGQQKPSGKTTTVFGPDQMSWKVCALFDAHTSAQQHAPIPLHMCPSSLYSCSTIFGIAHGHSVGIRVCFAQHTFVLQTPAGTPFTSPGTCRRWMMLSMSTHADDPSQQ